ncbi:hypothetical protein ACFV2N_28445 [Streptomyces sp. NPDC059680]|uniref:hypothetical protein n=1 Tax=Streptomyces sp. NPDC059680 TaxID=3346904 RepID=UPI0036B4BFCA
MIRNDGSNPLVHATPVIRAVDYGIGQFDRHARLVLPALPQQLRTPRPDGRNHPPQVASITVEALPQ